MSQSIKPPDVASLKRQITGASSEAPVSYTDSANQARSEKIDLDGREQFFKLRGRWSGWLLTWISALLLLEAFITLGIGYGWLNFLEYKWFLPIVFGESFLQIVAMGVVIVKFLYAPAK